MKSAPVFSEMEKIVILLWRNGDHSLSWRPGLLSICRNSAHLCFLISYKYFKSKHFISGQLEYFLDYPKSLFHYSPFLS